MNSSACRLPCVERVSDCIPESRSRGGQAGLNSLNLPS
jgi:hypothetical protein